jgi:UDP-3-O-[3-hydroxymyristoyl] glucosamine N-acyltransferase
MRPDQVISPFFENFKFLDDLAVTRAGACLVGRAPPRVAVLMICEPYRAFVVVARFLFPDSLRSWSMFAASGTAGAHVHASAQLESG